MIKRIEIILGCMFSGKSTELLRRLSRYEAINIDTLLINHSFDTRTGNSIKTHDNLEKKALKVKTLMEIVNTNEYLNSNVIGIDEAQFFTDLKEFVLYSEKNKTIIIAGLDGDSNREPFGEILNCIPLCDEVVKLTAMDMMKNDGTKAIFSLKKKIINRECTPDELNTFNNSIDIGSEDKYLAVSRDNFLQTKDK
tara:strand:+ start:123 stop:707 length:585 start_codon:yes stop_codon:yes gene_type:complete